MALTPPSFEAEIYQYLPLLDTIYPYWTLSGMNGLQFPLFQRGNPKRWRPSVSVQRGDLWNMISVYLGLSLARSR